MQGPACDEVSSQGTVGGLRTVTYSRRGCYCEVYGENAKNSSKIAHDGELSDRCSIE